MRHERGDNAETFRLLAIDDDPVNLQLLAGWVEGTGIELITAKDGQLGLEAMRNASPDVVLLDLIMPEMDGFEFLRQRATHAGLQEIPVILWSGQDDQARAAEGLDLGAFDYAEKGHDCRVTLARLRAAARFKRDRDSLIQANTDLQAAQRDAEAASAAKTSFLANMSHEIRTPLTSILGFAELSLESNLCESDRIAYSALIHSNAEHLLTLLNDILDLSKVEAGKMTVEQIPASPFEIVRQVNTMHNGAALDKGLNYEVEIDGRLPSEIRTDPTRLRQILLNLVSNAIKFTDEGGITIRVWFEAESGTLNFSVRDTGCGLTGQQLSRLFERFSQADSSTTRTHGGTGLGLVLCRNLAELLGGAIDVQSEPGTGTTFTLSLPGVEALGELTTLEATEKERQSKLVKPKQKAVFQGRVLLAEDTADSRHLIAMILTKMGLSVIAVENGREAYDLASHEHAAGQPFDVVFLDLHMPEMDGFEAIARLREEGYTNPIVALSAAALAEDRDACAAAGFDSFAAKPIQRQELQQTLANYLDSPELKTSGLP